LNGEAAQRRRMRARLCGSLRLLHSSLRRLRGALRVSRG
jgi:hypothetical protein